MADTKPALNIKKSSGALKRVTVELCVLDPAPMLEVQALLSKAMPDYIPKDAGDFHFTLYHFGLPDSLYEDFRESNPGLDKSLFLDRFTSVLHSVEKIIPEPIELRASGLVRLGNPRNPVVGLALQTNEQIMTANRTIGKKFFELLEECGVGQSDYYHSHPQKVFRPHISLGRLAQRRDLPSFDASRLSIKLSASALRNVEVGNG